KKLEESLSPTQSVEKVVLCLEEVLLSILEEDLISNKYVKLLNSFIYVNRYSNIKAFCDDTNINIKTLERICLKYTGYTPKILKRIYRFKMASNQLIYNYKDDELFDFIYENEYYDQAHFIKEFKKFSGTSPIKFIGENKTIKENIKYSYL
ncbi:TPA: helix-turn-helix domain-containing protein, partial [Clostridioides difficile]